MIGPFEITFHGVPHRDGVEALVRERTERLERFFGRLQSCRVVVEAPHRSQRGGNAYLVKIEATVPNREPVIVTHDHRGDEHDNLHRAIRDSFAIAERQLHELHDRQVHGNRGG